MDGQLLTNERQILKTLAETFFPQLNLNSCHLNSLSGAVSAINTAGQSSTEKSLFELVYGRLPVQQIENGISWPPERAESHSEFIYCVVAHRKDVWDLLSW